MPEEALLTPLTKRPREVLEAEAPASTRTPSPDAPALPRASSSRTSDWSIIPPFFRGVIFFAPNREARERPECQIFHPSTNTPRRSASSAPSSSSWFLPVGAAIRAPYNTQQGVRREQPVPFSHQHHGRMGPTAVTATRPSRRRARRHPADRDLYELSLFPKADSSTLEPVRESYRTGRSIA
jgi:hypothetical protein